MSDDYVEIILLKVGVLNSEGVLYTESALRAYADGKNKFYDEQRRALMWKGSQRLLLEESLKARTRIENTKRISSELFQRLTRPKDKD